MPALQGSCSATNRKPLAIYNPDGTIGCLVGTVTDETNPNGGYIQFEEEVRIAGTASLTIEPGSLLRSFNKSITLNGIQIFSDIGDPAVNPDSQSAPTGSLYSRKDGSPGSTLYVKTSTGWIAIA